MRTDMPGLTLEDEYWDLVHQLMIHKGDLAESTRRFEEALAIARESGDSRRQVLCLCNLAQTVRLAGELDQATLFYAEGLRLAHRLGAQDDILDSSAGLGGLALARRQFESAACLLGMATAVADALGSPLQPAEQAQFQRDVAAVQAALPEAAFSR